MSPRSSSTDRRILAFRYARSGLAERRTLPEALACPASDFARDAALLAVAARADGVTREAYDRAVDRGEVVVAHAIRGAIHALDPGDRDALGRALIATDDRALGAQLGRAVGQLPVAPTEALAEVAEAVREALAGGPLDRDALHDAMRARVRGELLVWCERCGSHHVPGALWRWATAAAGARLDSERRHVRGRRARNADPRDAVRIFLRHYGPSTAKAFGEWAGVPLHRAKPLWEGVELAEVDGGHVVAEDADALADPPAALGLRLLPPGDPFLEKPNRPLLAPDATLRKQLFRAVGSPGVILHDGRVAGTWRRRAGRVELAPARQLPKRALAAEIDRLPQ